MNEMQRNVGTVQQVRERIAEWCAWFDLAPPKLRVRKDSIFMTDDLCRWLRDSGASFDWIFCGDAQGMAQVFRERELEALEIEQAFSGLDGKERGMMLEALLAHRSGEISFDVAISKFQADVTAYRAGEKAVSAIKH